VTTHELGRAASDGFPGGLTVLMAAYRGDVAERVDAALRSVYENTLLPDEVVLVVDGPVASGTAAVIERYERDRGTRVLRLRENRGLAAALNHGLAHVRTGWVARADADDVNVPDRFERLCRAVTGRPGGLDLVGGAIVEVDSAGVAHSLRSVPNRHAEIVRRLVVRNPFNHMTVAYRVSMVRDAGGYPEIPLKEDYALWAAMIARGAVCANLPDVLVVATAGREMYRRRGGLVQAMSELQLQRFLVRQGVQTAAGGLVMGTLRALLALAPVGLRGWAYRTWFRRPAADHRGPGVDR
jgi:hypothetical protein